MVTRRFALLFALALSAPAARAEDLVDGIAAQVGSDIVLVSDVYQRSAPLEAQLVAAGAPPSEIARLRADVLEGLIERALIRQLVRRGELEASDADVDAAVAEIAAKNGLSQEQLRESVESQGMAFGTYRDQIRAQIEHTRVLNGLVASRVHVEDAELRQIYEHQFAEAPAAGEEVHLRHLLLPAAGEQPEQRRAACQTAEAALQRIRAGEDFGAVAGELSAANPQRGGDLGWLHVGSLAAWMAPAVAKLAVGESSDVIETPFGCNVLQLVERRSYERPGFEDVKEQLRKRVLDERMQGEYIAFTEKLRSQTFVERKGLFSDAARLGSAGPSAVPDGGGAQPPAEGGSP